METVAAAADAVPDRIVERLKIMESELSKTVLTCWLLGIFLLAKTALVVIAVSNSDFSFAVLTTPVVLILWLNRMRDWREERRDVADLRSQVPGYEPPDNSGAIKVAAWTIGGIALAVVATIMIRPA